MQGSRRPGAESSRSSLLKDDETAVLLRELDHTCRTVRLLGVYTK